MSSEEKFSKNSEKYIFLPIKLEYYEKKNNNKLEYYELTVLVTVVDHRKSF